jgi:hypothetical protein
VTLLFLANSTLPRPAHINTSSSPTHTLTYIFPFSSSSFSLGERSQRIVYRSSQDTHIVRWTIPCLALYRFYFYGSTTYDDDDEEELGSFIRDEGFKLGGRGGYVEGDEDEVIEAGQGRSDEEKQTRELGGGSSWDFTWWSGSRVIIDVGLGRQRTRTRSRLRSRAQRLLKRKGRGRGSGPGSRCRAIKVCGRKKELFKGRSTKRNTLDHGHPTRSMPSFVPLQPDYLFITSGFAPLCGFSIPPRTRDTRDRCRSDSTRHGLYFLSIRTPPTILLFFFLLFLLFIPFVLHLPSPRLGLKGPYQPPLLSTSTNPIRIFVIIVILAVRRRPKKKTPTQTGRLGQVGSTTL